jgi:hypothetical protein
VLCNEQLAAGLQENPCWSVPKHYILHMYDIVTLTNSLQLVTNVYTLAKLAYLEGYAGFKQAREEPASGERVACELSNNILSCQDGRYSHCRYSRSKL